MPYYAVAKGKATGIFNTWPECQDQITGFKGAVYKKFTTLDEAEQFIQERGSGIIDKRKKEPEVQQQKQSSSTSNPNGSKERSLSPTLVRMKKEMKDFQKQLSSLRDRFDEYVSSTGPSGQPLGVKRENESATSSSKPAKRTKMIDAPSGVKAKGKFSVDEDGFLVVFTDGACQFNGRKGAQAGVGVYFGSGHPLNVSEPVKGRATNNTAEIQAATYAAELTKAAGFDKVVIKTDSQFMINCMTSWLPGWKKNHWKKKDGSEVINKEDLMDLDKASDGLLIKWEYVKAHDGIEGNEAADRLATEGAKKYVIQSTEEDQ